MPCEREESLINFQIRALMCLIALSFPTSLVSELPPWTAEPGPCGYRGEVSTCVFIGLVIIRCTIAAGELQKKQTKKTQEDLPGFCDEMKLSLSLTQADGQ